MSIVCCLLFLRKILPERSSHQALPDFTLLQHFHHFIPGEEANLDILSLVKMLDQQVNGLPFWENGVKFFTIEGPNKEKIEFCEKL